MTPLDTARLFGPDRPRRPNVMAQHHVVVSGHYYASQAGFQILEAGGNAIDAGVATGLAIDVLESQFVGFGGVAPIMVRLADGTVAVVNGVGPWPAAADIAAVPRQVRRPHSGRPAAYRRAGRAGELDRGAAPLGHHVVRRRRARRDPFRPRRLPGLSVLPRDHRVETARDRSLSIHRRDLPARRRAAAGGFDLQTGRPRAHPAIHGGRRNAPPPVPDGRPGCRRRTTRSTAATSRQAIARHQRENGGWLAYDDLARFRAKVEPPCRTRFRDFDVYGCGAWSQGPMVLEALNILEGSTSPRWATTAPAYIHAVTEALKLAAADREAYFGDPDFVDVPLIVLLSKDYAATASRRAGPGRAPGRACRRQDRRVARRRRPGIPTPRPGPARS